ncbi:MAG: glycosyltransferase family 2 protein [Candidatus Symbiothrix sp.]|nr:glycosyltransferase family 2 protein [Candidatus Symbiothrix sp.]
MKLSIVIVNYNVRYFLAQCLDSALRAVEGMEAEILVVDNHSSDSSLDYLIPKFPGVKFIENTTNVGFSKANNQAIALSSGEYILLLNPDTIVGENTFANVCRFMDENPRAGAVGVKMLDGYGEFLPESKRGFPSPWNSFCKMMGLSRLFPQSKKFGGYHVRYLSKDQSHEVDVLAGAFMMLRRKAIEKSGLLDESFFMYGEDIDLSYRISRSGYANYYFPEPIIHYKGESTKKDIKYVKRFYEAMLIFFNKHYPHSNRLFKYLIRMAIVGAGFLSALRKLFKRTESERKPMSRKMLIFNKDELSYTQIIRKMDASETRTLFGIYHPSCGITIAANEVLINKTS